jgi:hypothetical protein
MRVGYDGPPMVSRSIVERPVLDLTGRAIGRASGALVDADGDAWLEIRFGRWRPRWTLVPLRGAGLIGGRLIVAHLREHTHEIGVAVRRGSLGGAELDRLRRHYDAARLPAATRGRDREP